ncbi:efflux RND transporter periplasmic adaptor subunit [Azospirillum sp. TSO35-2]|uniref:efflux RND transporter periplasmic adaptor subunit n=1 Tax=Azospirillum sp. TSO35-2 TaxID=716796 RepID=UPI001FFEA842|nr:efflux RND transporter periplasmic adaptor subunit [Azospirillum sp. TSO35-2]
MSSAVVGVALLVSAPVGAASWSRPADGDTDDALLSNTRRLQVDPAPSGTSWLSGAGAWVSGAAAAAAAPAGAIGSGLSATASALDQFAWEVAYVFGVNSTPVSQVHVPDPVHSSLQDTPPEDAGMPRSAAPPAAVAADAVPASPTKPPPSPPPAAPVSLASTPAKPFPAVVTTASVDTRLLAGLALDKPHRLSDGSYFVPKPLQRMFDIRVQKVDSSQSPLTARMPGRIVPDPNAHGDVESSLVGRIEPPKNGMPVLGETVKRGQILGYVTPAVGVVDRTQVRREVARLTNEIRITAESLEILKQFWFVPFRDGKVMQAELRLDGLRRERAALLPLLQTQEALRSGIDGVISVSNAINGRVVHPGEKIFEIVNPDRLWIEAIAADPEVARSAALGDPAIASTPEGETLDLTFIGSGLALQQQSVPLMFRIDNPIAGLRVGRPVTVTVRNSAKVRQGISITRDALISDSSGVEQVWEMLAPEIFIPHPVKTESLDGPNVLIVAGVDPGARIVTRGSRLLSQLQ